MLGVPEADRRDFQPIVQAATKGLEFAMSDDEFDAAMAALDHLNDYFADLVAQLLRILRHRDRMHVDHAVDAREVRLQGDEALDGAEVVAEMQVAGGLDPGEHALGEGRHHGLPQQDFRVPLETGATSKDPADFF
jgi:hypothetical protein